MKTKNKTKQYYLVFPDGSSFKLERVFQQEDGYSLVQYSQDGTPQKLWVRDGFISECR